MRILAFAEMLILIEVISCLLLNACVIHQSHYCRQSLTSQVFRLHLQELWMYTNIRLKI